MYNLLKVTLIFILLATKVYAADKIVTIYADNSYPPYSFVDKKTQKYIKNYKIVLKPAPWKFGLKMVESGQGFAIYPPYLHYDKRPYMWPYSLPMAEERTVLFCREAIIKKKLKKFPSDYQGLKIVMNRGFQLGTPEYDKMVKEKKITHVEVRGNKEGILLVASKRADCYFNDYLSILYELKALKASGEYKEGKMSKLSLAIIVKTEYGFIGYARKAEKFPFKEDFKIQMDKALYEMIRFGKIDKIIQSYQ